EAARCVMVSEGENTPLNTEGAEKIEIQRIDAPEASSIGQFSQDGPQHVAPLQEEGQAAEASTEDGGGRLKKLSKRKKKGEEKPTLTTKPGEIMVSRRLYRSGQSEYLINDRVARLRDIQEMFMGVGLGPDSYAIIEQGRIGLILSTKPMERRAIIEEAAGKDQDRKSTRLNSSH